MLTHTHKKTLYTVYKRPTSDTGTHRESKGTEKRSFHANENQKKAGVAICMIK